jgi:hypothetical protein
MVVVASESALLVEPLPQHIAHHRGPCAVADPPGAGVREHDLNFEEEFLGDADGDEASPGHVCAANSSRRVSDNTCLVTQTPRRTHMTRDADAVKHSSQKGDCARYSFTSRGRWVKAATSLRVYFTEKGPSEPSGRGSP